MSLFKRCHQNRQPDSLIHGLEGLTASADEHHKRLLWLAQSITSHGPTDMVWFLDHLQTRLALLELYQDYFPRQWQHSNADTRLLNLERNTPRELELFDLLDESHFPCAYDSTEFQSGYSLSPLVPEWGEYDWEDTDCLVQCYAGLTGYNSWEAVLEQYNLQDSDLERPAPLEKVISKRLETLCRTLESPLKWLHKSFEIIEHSTENPWLDSHYTDPEALEWNHASIDFLTATYKEAKDWLEKFNELNDWLYVRPERIGLLVALWNEAQPERDIIQLEIPFVTTISSNQWATGAYLRELNETRHHFEQLIYRQ